MAGCCAGCAPDGDGTALLNVFCVFCIEFVPTEGPELISGLRAGRGVPVLMVFCGAN